MNMNEKATPDNRDIPRMFRAKIVLNTSYTSQSTSTPLKSLMKSDMEQSLEESSNVLRSILGVSPVPVPAISKVAEIDCSSFSKSVGCNSNFNTKSFLADSGFCSSNETSGKIEYSGVHGRSPGSSVISKS